MPVTAFVMACVGPVCNFTAVDGFASVRQCERMAPFIGGISRAEMTSLTFNPAEDNWRLAFRCVDGRTREVLLSFDSGGPEYLAKR